MTRRVHTTNPSGRGNRVAVDLVSIRHLSKQGGVSHENQD